MRPSCAQKVSQMLGPRPSSSAAPSIWYAAVLVPNRKPAGSCGKLAGAGEGRVGEGTGTIVPVTVEIRRGSERFSTREDGRLTRHSFSFGAHYDPGNTGFGPLVCHDDHRLRSGTGFEEHPHADVEIVSWVLEGALEHSTEGGAEGRAETVRPGTVQVQSAGSGIKHREVAAAGAGPLRFVQAWLTPDETGGDPSYDVAPVTLPDGELVPVASGHREDGAVRLGVAGATFWVARLPGGATLRLPEEPLQHVFVGRGALIRSSLAQPLADGDAFRITDEPGHELTAAVPTELLVWTFTG